MGGLVTSIVDLLFPTRCVVCGALDRQPLCSTCAAGLPFIEAPICGRCGNPTLAQVDGCRACLGEHLPYSRCRSLGLFEGSMREVVHALKYANGRRLAPILAELAVERLGDGFLDVDLITFVPLHASKQSERGYNQSELVAQKLARLTPAPAAGVLRQVSKTADQSQLPAEERRANVRGAFDLRASKAEIVAGSRLVLVDDVFTTGSTVAECCRVLRSAKAADVRVLTLARAPLC